LFLSLSRIVYKQIHGSSWKIPTRRGFSNLSQKFLNPKNFPLGYSKRLLQNMAEKIVSVEPI